MTYSLDQRFRCLSLLFPGTIVVTGASGLTGYHVVQRLQGGGRVMGLYHTLLPPTPGVSWHSCDLRDRPTLHALLDHCRPTTIIHCAAHTDTSYCEQHPQHAHDLNVGGTENLVLWAARNDCFLLHVSTDLVFDGTKGNYREEDETNPISVYGRTKLAAEQAMQGGGVECCIVRTSLIYGRSLSGSHSVDEKLQDQWKQGNPTPLFVDEYRCPTPVGELAAMLAEISRRKLTGLLHVAGSERVSRFNLGRRVARVLGYPPEYLIARKIDDVISIPPRARDVSLDISKARSLLTTEFSSLDDGLARELAVSLES